jgi:hypothetical protein
LGELLLEDGVMSEEEKKTNNTSEEEPAPKVKSPEGLPFMLDFSFSVSKLVVILLGLVTLFVSLISGAVLWMATLRSAAAMLSVGFLLWLLNWLISRDSLEIVRQEILRNMEEAQVEEVASTVEKVA